MLSPEEIRSRTFLVSLRGFDREEVREFLATVADEVAALQESVEAAEAGAAGEAGAVTEAGAETEALVVPPAADAGEARSPYAEIGQETQRILEAAQSAADDIRRRAEDEASRELKAARAEAAREIAAAERQREEIAAAVSALEEARDQLAGELHGVGRTLERLLRDLAPRPDERTTTVRAAMAEAARTDEPGADGAGEAAAGEGEAEAGEGDAEPPHAAGRALAGEGDAEPPLAAGRAPGDRGAGPPSAAGRALAGEGDAGPPHAAGRAPAGERAEELRAGPVPAAPAAGDGATAPGPGHAAVSTQPESAAVPGATADAAVDPDAALGNAEPGAAKPDVAAESGAAGADVVAESGAAKPDVAADPGAADVIAESGAPEADIDRVAESGAAEADIDRVAESGAAEADRAAEPAEPDRAAEPAEPDRAAAAGRAAEPRPVAVAPAPSTGPGAQAEPRGGVAAAPAAADVAAARGRRGAPVEGERTARSAARGVTERVPVRARGDALAPSHPKLVRRLKRGLQDVENAMLDRLRRQGARDDVERFLPGDDAVQALAELAGQHIANAYAVGYHAGASAIGQAAGDPPELRRALGWDLAHEIVDQLADRLREQLSAAFAEDADSAAVTGRVDAAFAGVRDGVVGEASAIALVRAYEWGQHDAWASFGVERRKWALATEPTCGDARCEDNAGSGAVALGEPFPSGHEVPPARAGCSCTTVPLVFRA